MVFSKNSMTTLKKGKEIKSVFTNTQNGKHITSSLIPTGEDMPILPWSMNSIWKSSDKTIELKLPPLRILWQTWNYDWPTDWQKDRHAHKEVPLEGWQLGDIVRKVFRGGGTSWARNQTVFRKLETLQIKLVVWLWSHVTESSAWGCDGVCLCMRDLKVYLLI